MFGGRGEGCVCGGIGMEGGGCVDALREKTLLVMCVTQVSLITSETHSFQ